MRLGLGFSAVIIIIIVSAWFSLVRLGTLHDEVLLVEEENAHAALVDEMAFFGDKIN